MQPATSPGAKFNIGRDIPPYEALDQRTRSSHPSLKRRATWGISVEMLRNTFKIREGDSAIGRSFGCPLPFWTWQSFYYYEPKNLVYLSNAKAGCSTIKSSFVLAIHKHLGMEPPGKLTGIHRKHPFWELNIGNCLAQFANCMHGRAMAVARQARGEAFSSSSRWNHRR